MTYAILGAGNVGKALAKAFARKDMEVTVASRSSVDELEPVVRAIGPKVYAGALQDAVKADVILLAVPFSTRNEVAKAAASRQGKLIIAEAFAGAL